MQATVTMMQRVLVGVMLMLVVIGVAAPGNFAVAQTAIACVASPSGGPATPAATPATASAPDAVFPESGELTVFAAASLTNAFTQIGDEIMAANPDIVIIFNFAGSQTLVTQLTQGAPADVFAAANDIQMQEAIDGGVIAGEPQTFAHNRLAIVVPADNPANISGPADLAQDDLRLVLALPEVPVGLYSRRAICAMGEDTSTYGEGFVEQVEANIVSQEEDVRVVLTKVQLGEADAGMVYVSDITADVSDDVEIIKMPEAVNVIATYPIAPVEGGDAPLAEAFIAYVRGPEGQSTLEDHGFTELP
ncbi:MAG: molybdate ABC transporter substrate-binding protein [Chloroflexota bacterium]|nr:molybdate ABC transporter substrate-binding protein [Chloroflexota bacterium]